MLKFNKAYCYISIELAVADLSELTWISVLHMYWDIDYVCKLTYLLCINVQHNRTRRQIWHVKYVQQSENYAHEQNILKRNTTRRSL